MRLIVATNSATTANSDRNALTAFIEAKKWSVWHWYPDLWLIDGAPATIDLPVFRMEIARAIPTLPQFLIITAEGLISHAGMVPQESAEWFTTHWDRR